MELIHILEPFDIFRHFHLLAMVFLYTISNSTSLEFPRIPYNSLELICVAYMKYL